MTAPTDLSALLRVPGRLILNPTSMTAAAPYGGTYLGVLRDHEVRWNMKAKIVAAEEWGGVASEVIYTGEALVLAALLRDYDATALGLIFPNVAAGSRSGESVVSQTVDAGTRAGTRREAHKLLFAPLAEDVMPFVYLPAARAILDSTAKLNLGLDQEAGIGAVWYAVPDDTGRTYVVGLRKDLTL
jgi:hypothetical protein